MAKQSLITKKWTIDI